MNETKGMWEYYEGIAAPAVIVKGKPNRPNKLICHARLFNGSEDLAEAQANATLIVSAVNGCKSVNEDCPEHVAEVIKPMYEALKQAEKILSTLLITQGLPPSESEVVYQIQNVLALAERRKLDD